MTKIKICGLTNLEDARAAVKFGADALGFIFTKKSPRQVSPEKVSEIICTLPPFITYVGLFVNESPVKVKEIAEKCRLDALQFHGEESPEYCRQFDRKVIKVFRIKNEDSFKMIAQYQEVDAYLMDAYKEGVPGGTGEVVNWDLVVQAAVKFDKPLILAGGLTLDNVAEAVDKVKPYAVDVSSGIEKEPGKKDHKKMEEFIKIVRRKS